MGSNSRRGRVSDEMSRSGSAGSVASPARDRKSTRLNSSHANISYAVFCLKKKNKHMEGGASNRLGKRLITTTAPNHENDSHARWTFCKRQWPLPMELTGIPT